MKQHILMITGGRSLRDSGGFEAHLTAHMARLREEAGEPLEITIIDGDARQGADHFSKEYCEKHGVPRLDYPADWKDLNAFGAVVKKNARGEFYNARAGVDRNAIMAEHCDSGLAFWDGESPGTGDAIKQLEKRGKPVHVVRYG